MIVHYLIVYFTILAFSTVCAFCLVCLSRTSESEQKMEFCICLLFFFLLLVAFGSLLFPAYYLTCLSKILAGVGECNELGWVGLGWVLGEGRNGVKRGKYSK